MTALINHYKSKGYNLAGLLDDPVFNKLSTAMKVRLIKEQAAVLASGPSGLNNHELKDAATSLALRAAVGAVVGGITGRQIQKSTGTPLGAAWGTALVGGAIAGAGTGVVSTAYDLIQRARRRNMLQAGLRDVAENPTDDAALGLVFKTTPHGSPSFTNRYIQHSINSAGGNVQTEVPKKIGPVLKEILDKTN